MDIPNFQHTRHCCHHRRCLWPEHSPNKSMGSIHCTRHCSHNRSRSHTGSSSNCHHNTVKSHNWNVNSNFGLVQHRAVYLPLLRSSKWKSHRMGTFYSSSLLCPEIVPPKFPKPEQWPQHQLNEWKRSNEKDRGNLRIMCDFITESHTR